KLFYIIYSLFCPSTLINSCCNNKKFLICLILLEHYISVKMFFKKINLQRKHSKKEKSIAEDTRCSLHFGTLLHVVSLFLFIVDVLEIVEEDDISFEQKVKSRALLNFMQSF
ncbi:hypothetical protein CR513_53296, partial [Mucuna pruriens]